MKTLSVELILGLKVTMNQVMTKRPCFGYFSRFATRTLTLRPRKTYIYVFQAFFGFRNF